MAAKKVAAMKPWTRLPTRTPRRSWVSPRSMIFRDETDDRGLEAEAGEPAEDDRPHPDDDEDAVLEIAHPAGEQHLADIGDGGGEDAHREGDQRDPLRHGAVVAAAEHAVERGGKRARALLQPALERALDESDETDPHGLSAVHCRIVTATIRIL